MSEKNNAITLTAEQLQELLSGILAKANQLNPLEARKYKEEISKENRRDLLKSLIASEVAATKARMLTCSHSRYPNGHKLAGHPCPKGQGEWATGGQLHGFNRIGICCLRCGEGWQFEGTPNEIAYVQDMGAMGFPPPGPDRALTQCVYCSELFTSAALAKHEDKCTKKYDRHIVDEKLVGAGR